LVAGCLLLALASLPLPVGLTYDPTAWLVWARDVVALDLDTSGLGPAWKPLPVLVAVAATPLGLAPEVWLVVARAGGLLALALSWRLAARVGGPLAGLVAVLVLVSTTGYVGDLVLPGMSEPLLAALVLLAVDRHLADRPTAALLALTAAGLLRPEVWPFLGCYGLLLWRRAPHRRLLLVVLAALTAVLWFGAEYWGSGDVLRSSTRAGLPTEGGPLLTASPGRSVVESAVRYPVAAAWVGVAAAVTLAALGRRRLPHRGRPLIVGLVALAGLWTVLVAAMTQARLSAGEQRYLLVAAAAAAVLAGIGWAEIARALTGLVRGGVRDRTAGVLAAVVFVLSWPSVEAESETWWQDLEEQYAGRRLETAAAAALPDAVAQAGGAPALRRCGGIATGNYQVPVVAWVTGVSLPDVEFEVPASGVLLWRPAEREPLPVLPAAYRPVPLTGAAVARWQVFTTCRVP
jgi:hypothetical protein